MAKNISKSVRLTNEVYEYVNDFNGEGFNEKFENIVIFCMKSEAERKKKLDSIDRLIKSRSEELANINSELETARSAAYSFRNVMNSLRYIK